MNYFGKLFKYELRRRSMTITLLLGIMVGLTLIATLLSLPFRDEVFKTFGTPAIFMFFSQASLIGIPFFMFFYSGAGFSKTLLYQNSNYLLLSLPVPSYVLLGAHIVAGLVEFLLYAVVAVLLEIWNVFFVSSAGSTNFADLIYLLGVNIRANWAASLLFIASVLLMFFFIGTLILAVAIFIRSFIRKRRHLATAISVFVSLFLLFKLIDKLSRMANVWVWELKMQLYSFKDLTTLSLLPSETTMNISLVPLLSFLVLSIAFFSIASWILKNKIEV